MVSGTVGDVVWLWDSDLLEADVPVGRWVDAGGVDSGLGRKGVVHCREVGLLS